MRGFGDNRDIGAPGAKEWEEFRAGFAAARLFAWLLDELDEVAPGYVEDLRGRIDEGISAGELMAQEDPDYDGAAIIHSPVRREAKFIDHDEALLLEDQLFPDWAKPDPRDFAQATRGLALVAMHGALETYAVAVGVDLRRRPLPEAIQRHLARRTNGHVLDASLADSLTLIDETRHVIVHHRGAVSERFVRNVKYTTLEIGEIRSLSPQDIYGYAQVLWRVATLLRDASA